jgi:predicted TIM-barrel fold metal-dependent hydrolase
VTTSGYFTSPPFTCCREVVGLERMMYSVDYPFSSNTQGKEYLERLQLSDDEHAAFVGGNAARVLGL